MKRLLLGTANPAKISRLRAYLHGLDLEILAPEQVNISIKVEENGETPEENAAIKAGAYCRHAGLPTLAVDAALHIDGLADTQQPGVYVRRIDKSQDPASDRQLLDYYSQAIHALGGRCRAWWRLGIALALNEEKLGSKSFTLETVFTNVPSAVVIPGEPLSSLMMDPDSGQYFSEWDFRQRPDGFAIRDFVSEILRL